MAFRGVRRNLGLFFGLTSLLIGVPAALFALPSARTVINNGLRASFPAGPGDWVISGVAVIWWAVGSSILHGALTYALAAPAEKQASIVEALRVGVSRAPAMAGLGVVMIVATILGFVALIVPGFMVLTAWFVAPPALIIERIGIRAALKRSAALTKGSRWLVLLVAVLSSLISTRGSNQGLGANPGLVALLMGLLFVGAVLNVIVGVALSWAAYVELRRVKEGIGPEGVEAVFD